ncbi:MAG TPA: sigma 54-interacting transcriptional regulator [Kofleriaceae bacterium]|nr:sigma 54-interacting transcriptional regulator [Kofleriaceae bacterium]
MPQLIIALDCDRPMAAPSRHVLDGLDEVTFGRGDRRVRRDGTTLAVRLPDPRMSTEHGRLVRQGGGWVLDDPSSKNGCVVNGSLMRRRALADGDVLELGHTFCLFRVAPAATGEPDLDADQLTVTRPDLATFGGDLERAFARLTRIAATDVPVLIHGETGTGKEVVARAVHELSARRGPFVAINCGALTESLLEAELFGARKGAFSGATADRIGLVRAADGGTLFLDEIAELRPHSQAALLRVLQEREVIAIGDTKPVRVDVRFCAATHRKLEDLVDRGGFRADLYARLYGYVADLPPLRQRREDLGLLVRALLRRTPGGERARFTPSSARLLFRHDWPRNVRELEKALASAVPLAEGRAITPDDLPEPLRREQARAAFPTPAPPPLDDDALRARLVSLLESHDGNVAAVARAMGKERMQIHRWARRFGLDLGSYRR